MRRQLLPGELKAELLRKGIHLLIALVPSIAALNRSHAALLLMTGTLFYTWAESMRFLGFSPPLVSSVTEAVLRRREKGRFALAPVTLGLGALLSLLVFPPAVAAAAVYALAFGDSAGTVVGKFAGRFRPAFLAGKSFEGSLACFAASFIAVYLVFFEWKMSLAAGFAALLVDIFPLGDLDNILMPLAVGFSLIMFLNF